MTKRDDAMGHDDTMKRDDATERDGRMQGDGTLNTKRLRMMRVPSPLDDETEECVYESMECGFAVHKAIGPGYNESIYRNAFCVELLARNIPFEREKSFVVTYRGQPVGTHRLDVVVRGRVTIELKAVKVLERVHEAQVLAYLKASELPVALLMNFGAPKLKEGLKRIVR